MFIFVLFCFIVFCLGFIKDWLVVFDFINSKGSLLLTRAGYLVSIVLDSFHNLGSNVFVLVKLVVLVLLLSLILYYLVTNMLDLYRAENESSWVELV
jgi:hypothetical protein